MYHNFTLHQLLACDYPEIIDETMKINLIKIQYEK